MLYVSKHGPRTHQKANLTLTSAKETGKGEKGTDGYDSDASDRWRRPAFLVAVVRGRVRPALLEDAPRRHLLAARPPHCPQGC